VSEDVFQQVLKQSLVPESGITERQLDAVTNYYRAYDDQIDYKRMASMFDSSKKHLFYGNALSVCLSSEFIIFDPIWSQ
jgi:hypothetical protein